MNKVILMGRLTREPDYKQSKDVSGTDFCKYTLAVDRRVRRDKNDANGQTADFISCVVFGKGAQFAYNYLHQGTKVVVTGHLQTGKYTNKEGQTVYTTDVVVEDQEFAESKATQDQNYKKQTGQDTNTYGAHVRDAMSGNSQRNDYSEFEGGFIDIPEGIDANLPFR